MKTNIFKAQYHPEQVRGHQLERLRLRLLQLPRKPMRPFCRWDGQHLHIGRPSRHRTLSGRHINMIARIKRRRKTLNTENEKCVTTSTPSAAGVPSLPVALYHHARADGTFLPGESCVCEDDVYTGNGDDDTIGVPLVRLADALTAISTQPANIAQPVQPKPFAEICDYERATDDDGRTLQYALVYALPDTEKILPVGTKLFAQPAQPDLQNKESK